MTDHLKSLPKPGVTPERTSGEKCWAIRVSKKGLFKRELTDGRS